MVKAVCARQSQVRFSDISVLIMYQCVPSHLFLLFNTADIMMRLCVSRLVLSVP